ncbi:MAG: hypothetical protein D3924_17450 [Candidatus Electrothrix sp. AR4]|nr:hypothetical protein [Candidatus Electrothrix sp. AR4]
MSNNYKLKYHVLPVKTTLNQKVHFGIMQLRNEFAHRSPAGTRLMCSLRSSAQWPHPVYMENAPATSMPTEKLRFKPMEPTAL